MDSRMLRTNKQHNAQISEVLKEAQALKRQSLSQSKLNNNEPGNKISEINVHITRRLMI